MNEDKQNLENAGFKEIGRGIYQRDNVVLIRKYAFAFAPLKVYHRYKLYVDGDYVNSISGDLGRINDTISVLTALLTTNEVVLSKFTIREDDCLSLNGFLDNHASKELSENEIATISSVRKADK